MTTASAIKEFMSANLCRCGAYPNIVGAVEQARDAMVTTGGEVVGDVGSQDSDPDAATAGEAMA